MTEQLIMLESKLVEKCLKKDRRAQQELFNKYKDAMYTLAYRITKNHDEASDCLQDSFINVFLKLNTFKASSTLGAWIKTIVVRNAIKRTKASFVYEDLMDVSQESDYKIDENLTGEAIEQAIFNLDDGYRTIFLLIEVEGYKHKEVAELLRISEGTSKSQLFYAKRQLRKQLHAYNT